MRMIVLTTNRALVSADQAATALTAPTPAAADNPAAVYLARLGAGALAETVPAVGAAKLLDAIGTLVATDGEALASAVEDLKADAK